MAFLHMFGHFLSMHFPGLVPCIRHSIPDDEDCDAECKTRESPFRSNQSSPNLRRKCDQTRHCGENEFSPWEDSQDLSECCPICLDELIVATCYVLPRCGHMIHIYCMDMWSQKKPKCPICWRSVSTNFGGVCVPEDVALYISYGAPKRKRILRAKHVAKGLW